MKIDKELSASPNPHQGQGLCPWTLLGALPPDPRLGSSSACSPWSAPWYTAHAFWDIFKFLLYTCGKGKLGKCVQIAKWLSEETTLAENKRTRNASGHILNSYG